MHTVKKVSGAIIWANLHLLFWLSLIPFVTGWMGENSFAPMTMAMYGIILLMSAIAYFILQNSILSVHGEDWVLAKAVGSDFKGKLSPVFYILGIASSWISSWLAALFYVLAALLWLIPDTRIERSLNEKEKRKS